VTPFACCGCGCVGGDFVSGTELDERTLGPRRAALTSLSCMIERFSLKPSGITSLTLRGRVG
jgi:hypothetical protein